MKRKVLAMFMAAALAGMVLSGCGSEPAETAEKSAEAVEAPVEEPAEESEEAQAAEEEETAEEEMEQDGSTVYLKSKATRVIDGETELLYEVEYDDHGNPLEVSRPYDTVEYEYEYNERGQVTRATQTVVPEDPGMESYVQETDTYEYDEEGVLLKGRKEKNEVDFYMPELNMTRIWDIEYNTDGEMAKSVQSWLEGEDSEARVVSDLTYDYEYDGEGRKVKMICTEDGAVSYTEDYEYDAAGGLTKKTETSMTDGNPAYVYEYEYDENGNQIKETWEEVGEDGTMEVTEELEDTYEYEYDENGNVIKQVWVGEDDYRIECLYEYIEMKIPDIKYYRLGDGEDGEWHYDLR